MRRAVLAALVVAGISATAAVARAQELTPLERKVSVPVTDISLREALERISVAARVRFSYASEALPLERSVHTRGDTVTLAALLEQLLSGVAVTPVVAGPNQIVLVQSRPAIRSLGVRSQSIGPAELARVIVSGTPSTAARPASISLSTIDRDQIARSGAMSLADVLDAGAPGMWMWESGSSSGFARYGSIRGASSLGATYPKIYIDGINVANPLLLTTLDPDGIERIEVIRGPQGAALYGSDAISGVINIVSRREYTADGSSRVRVRSIAGISNSDYADAGLTQNHFVSIAGGSPLRSGQIGLGASTLGDYYENAGSRHLSASAAFREVRSRMMLTGTARLASSTNGLGATSASDSAMRTLNGFGPGFGQRGTMRFGDSADVTRDLSLTAYTLGVTAHALTSDRWTNTLVLGVDGYRLKNFASAFTPFPSSTDSALRAARGSADRTTARLNSSVKFGAPRRTSARVGLVLERSALRAETPVVVRGPATRALLSAAVPTRVDALTDYGVGVQTDVSVHEKLYITSALRVERNEGYATTAPNSVLPMIGASFVQDVGRSTLKWRVAYGSGVRAPRTAARETMIGGMRAQESVRELAPERQSGIEAGFDLVVGRTLSLQITGFNQLASGLIQQVVVPDATISEAGSVQDRLSLSYQNVGAISNRGIEIEAMLRRGPLQFRGAFAGVSSRVRSIAENYSGDLRAGDRALGVPARTLTGSVTWASNKWNATVGASRAFDWVEYDRLALAAAYTQSGAQSAPLYGADLRSYWRDYAGNTRLRASLSRTIGRTVTALVTGDNLLGGQRGEPDNATVVPGRTFSAGWRVLLF